MKRLFVILAICVCFGYSLEFNYGANVRDGFVSGSAIIDTVPKNVEVSVISTNSLSLFVEILNGTHAGKKGYIYYKLLTNDVIGGQGASVRASYQKGSEILFACKGGTKIKILNGFYNWYKVSYVNNGLQVEGWISEENLKK